MDVIKHDRCKHFLDRICDELAEDINSPLCQEMREHLKHCEMCCTSLESMRLTVKLFKKLYDENVPDDINTKFWKKLGLTKDC